MRKFLVVIIFIVCLGIGAQAQQTTGSTTLTVSTATPSAGALLTGAVVTADASNGANSTISVPVPSGWSLVWARGFEGNPATSPSETITTGASGGVTSNYSHS